MSALLRGVAAVVFAVAAVVLSAVGGTRQVAPWIDEKISTAGDTGDWSRDVSYNRTTGVAKLDGEYVFTPTNNQLEIGNIGTRHSLRLACSLPHGSRTTARGGYGNTSTISQFTNPQKGEKQ